LQYTGLPRGKEPINIALNLIKKPVEFVPIRYASGEHNAMVACSSRFATTSGPIARRTIARWFGFLRYLDEFRQGFNVVEKSKGTLNWIDRFESNRAIQFIRAKYGTVEKYLRARKKQLEKEGKVFCEKLFEIQCKKIFKREIYVDPKEDRPVNYKMMAKHDEYTVNHNCTKGPRAVCIPANHYLVSLGPWTWTFGEQMKEVWNKNNRIVYTSGLSAEDIGQLLSEYPVWYCGDFSGYDASLRWFHIMTQIIIIIIFFPRAHVKRLLWRTMDCRIRMPNFRYTGIAKTKSGHPGTSCLNTLLTAWIFFVACKLAGVENFKLLVSGDDTAIAMHVSEFPMFVRILENICTSTGLVIVGEVKCLYDVDYNSQVLYPTHDGWVLGPRIIRGSKRFVYSLDSPLKLEEHVKQLTLAESLNVGFVPILRDALQELVDQYGIAKALGSWMDRRQRCKVAAKSHHKLDEENWKTVCAWRYGKSAIDWSDQQLIELAEQDVPNIPMAVKMGNYPDYSYFAGPFES